MKNAKKIYDIGQLLIVLGSILYVVELLTCDSWKNTLCIAGVYVVALVLTLIGWCGTKEERQAQKAQEKAEKEQKKAAA